MHVAARVVLTFCVVAKLLALDNPAAPAGVEGGSGGGVVQVFILADVGSFLGLGGRGWVVAKKVGGRSLGSLLLWVLVEGS